MSRKYPRLRPVPRVALMLAVLIWTAAQLAAQARTDEPGSIVHQKFRKTTQAQRQAAADSRKARFAAATQPRNAVSVNSAAIAAAEPVVGQGDVPDYYSLTVPNWNYTPPLRKFIDTLPLLTPEGSNNRGQYIPVAVPDKNAYPGLTPGSESDYYEIAVVQYTQQVHSELPATTFRGYVQIDTPAIPDTPTKHALTYPDGSPILDKDGNQVFSVDRPRYLGPVIVARRDVPVRIKFTNYLPTTAAGGDLFIPVDTSAMGAGMGPEMAMVMSASAVGNIATITTHHMHPFTAGQKVMLHGFTPAEYNGEFTVLPTGLDARHFQVALKKAPGGPATVVGEAAEMYTENRAVVHLHGGRTPWISDGTPHQWITPAGENTSYPQGVSVQEVPDMPGSEVPDDGSTTLYYTNQQSARLMFYHDHVYGITRLNVYAGEAAGYLIRDDIEESLIAGHYIPADEIPLIIQDKTFVDADTIGDLDPTWRWGTGADNDGNGYPDYRTGDLWVPHVYMPAQNPFDITGMAAMGRWHYGPWFWPPTTGIGHPPIPNPYYDPENRPWQGEQIPDVPDPSMGMEAFNDTPLVNGAAYPTLTVDPKAYRFRILNAANDRFFNLQLYEADPAFDMPGAGLTEVRMVDAAPHFSDPTWPQDFTEGNPTWPVDGREGGVPDWNTRGPGWIQIGTEGGFLPMPVVRRQRPIDWNVDVTTFDAGIVNSSALLLAPAERADVIVDFSAYPGKTLILFNDAPAAFPAPDPRYDYYTNGPDLTDTGGRWPTDPGYGPNTRTIMQIKVNPDPVADEWLGFDAMNARWQSTATQDGVFVQAQDPIIVTQGELIPGYDQYNKAYNATFPSRYPDWGIARIHNTSLSFKTLDGATATIPLEAKAIQDEMGETFDDFGRMAGKLGLQLPNPPAGDQTFVLQTYMDPATEIITSMTPLSPPLAADGTQLWKITHNGVDVHPIHFHLFDVQLINRVAWDNNVRLPDPNELGWKDTVRVNPLQDTIVALRPVAPALPFKLPDSIRLLDPAMPEGFQWQSFDPYTAEAVTVTNNFVNFGWEYMWHCHILSHEEMEMMRPIVFNVSPAVPSGLTAQAAGAAVNLTWANDTTSPAATSLLIRRATNASFTQNVVNFTVADPHATAYLDTDTAGGTAYYYQIRAENDISYSAWSATASATTGESLPTDVPPADPSSLRATLQAGAQVALAWTDNSDNETHFEIERSENGGAWTLIASPTADSVAYIDTTVVPGNSYDYRVRAANAGASSGYSNTAGVTVPLPAPAAPSNLLAVLQAGPQVALTWMDNAATEAGFQVERRVNSGAYVLIASPAANATNYLDTTVVPGNTYTYRVRAVNATGPSAYSNTTAVALPSPPAAPTNLTAAVLTGPRVQLSYRDNTKSETGFEIERRTNGGAWVLIASLARRTATGATTYIDTTVEPGNTYSYRVRAMNGLIPSAYSNIASVAVPTLPAAPTGFTGVLASNNKVANLAWTDNSTNEQGFRVFRSTNGGASWSQVASLVANSTTYRNTGLSRRRTYLYRVQAFNGAGVSDFTNVLTITVP